uniref:Uncharacterized protein n=1 Tax=Kalanchoe fedtschenkoi TaxID=63787 RepID=A0A7N0VKI7_KALFE
MILVSWLDCVGLFSYFLIWNFCFNYLNTCMMIVLEKSCYGGIDRNGYLCLFTTCSIECSYENLCGTICRTLSPKNSWIVVLICNSYIFFFVCLSG